MREWCRQEATQTVDAGGPRERKKKRMNLGRGENVHLRSLLGRLLH